MQNKWQINWKNFHGRTPPAMPWQTPKLLCAEMVKKECSTWNYIKNKLLKYVR